MENWKQEECYPNVRIYYLLEHIMLATCLAALAYNQTDVKVNSSYIPNIEYKIQEFDRKILEIFIFSWLWSFSC